MTDMELHVHGEDSQEVGELVKKLRAVGYTVLHCVGISTEPLVVGPNGEQFRGSDIEKTFFVA